MIITSKRFRNTKFASLEETLLLPLRYFSSSFITNCHCFLKNGQNEIPVGELLKKRKHGIFLFNTWSFQYKLFCC